MMHCPGDGHRTMYHRDIRPSVLAMDSSLLCHIATGGFAKTPAATTLFRRWRGGTLCHATVRGIFKAFSAARLGDRRWCCAPHHHKGHS